MLRTLLPANAAFSAANKTITFSGTVPLSLSHIRRVINLDRAAVYYDAEGGTGAGYLGSYASPVLTLRCSTEGHTDGDALFIEYDDGQGFPALQSGAVPVGDNGSSLTVDGRSGSPAVTFSRPSDTTPYGASDVIGSASTANLEAPSAGASGALIRIESASVLVNATSVPSGLMTFRIHVWDSAPTAIADNAAFSTQAADRSKYCGHIDMAAIQAIGGGFCWTHGDYVGRAIRLTGTSFFFNLAMSGSAGHTPASGTEFRVRFHTVEVGL